MGPGVLGSLSGLGFAWTELDLRASCFELPLLFCLQVPKLQLPFCDQHCWVTEWELELRNLELVEIEYPGGLVELKSQVVGFMVLQIAFSLESMWIPQHQNKMRLGQPPK